MRLILSRLRQGVINISDSTDLLVIACSLLFTVALAYVSLHASEFFISSSNEHVSMLAGLSDASELTDLDGRMIPGDQALEIVDTYRDSVPILLVTGELYHSASKKFSYDSDRVHDQRADEYMNPGFSFQFTVYREYGEIVCLGFVQDSIASRGDAETYYSTARECQASLEQLTKTDNLVQKQFQLYQLLKQDGR